jgi:hypothetical protein
MNHKKLTEIKESMEKFRRRGGIKSEELESLTKEIGRVKSKRGKEPTWVSSQFSDLRPLSIPNHTHDLNKFTARSILDQLESDVEKWEEYLESSEN